MAAVVVFAGACALVVATALSYLILGAASDSRSADEGRRRQHAMDAFAAVLFAEDTSALASFQVRNSTARDALLEVVSSLPVHLGQDGRDRLAAVLCTPRTMRTFNRLVTARRWSARVDAARLCGLMGSSDQRCRLLSDRHWAVRVVAVAALSPEQVAEHADEVAGLLLDPDPAVRIAAAETLPSGGVDVTLPLNAILSQTGPDREAALVAACRITDRLLLGSLSRHARSDHTENRVLAAAAIARQSPIEAEPILFGLLDDREPRVRATAAEGLGRIGSNRVFTPLRAMLFDESWLVRRAAEQGLLAAGSAGGLLVRQHRRRRAELPVSHGPSPAVPLPIRREERVRS
ncbi:MAG: HEAT repeat domain-containing protein [Acidimicrobiales bacterium]